MLKFHKTQKEFRRIRQTLIHLDSVSNHGKGPHLLSKGTSSLHYKSASQQESNNLDAQTPARISSLQPRTVGFKDGVMGEKLGIKVQNLIKFTCQQQAQTPIYVSPLALSSNSSNQHCKPLSCNSDPKREAQINIQNSALQ